MDLTGQREKEGEPVKGKQEGEIKRGEGSVSKEGKRKKEERDDRTESQWKKSRGRGRGEPRAQGCR